MKGGDKMNNKKGLSDIVTNVLIILLVLVSVSIIWMFLRPTIESGIGQTGGTTDCLTVDLEPTACDTNGGTVTVTRNPGGGDVLKGIKVLVNGALNDGGEFVGSLSEFETATVTINSSLSGGEEITVAAVVDNGNGGEKICSPSSRTFTCPSAP